LYPELFNIPFTELSVKSYGMMMVFGFLSAMFVIRRLSVGMGENAEHITSAALYSLICGVIGARIFYVVHYWDQFRGRGLLEIFAVWKGGLELLGGVIMAILVIMLYMRVKKLPVRRYLDILAIGLMLALAFGRIGCFLNGCCFGRPTNCAVGIHFPYGSPAYQSQTSPDPTRNRAKAYLDLPADFFGRFDEQGKWLAASEQDKYWWNLKPYEKLTDEQKQQVSKGPYRCLAVHPTQFYSSALALLVSLTLYLFWRWGRSFIKNGKAPPALAKSGCTFALMFFLYSACRFLLEFIRDDNPFGANGLTISQNMGIGIFLFGFVLLAVFALMKPGEHKENTKN
jgi:phosphatidylglycerol---prolipoprotein diacylglyceryl transferase